MLPTTMCGINDSISEFYEYKKFPTNLHSHAPVDSGVEQNQTILQKLKKATCKDPTKTDKDHLR